MLLNIRSLPRITNPNIFHCSSCQVSILVEHVLWKTAFLHLVLVLERKRSAHVRELPRLSQRMTYMQNEYREDGLLPLVAQFLSGELNIFLQFLDRIFQRRPRIIDLIHDQDPLPDQVLHLPQTRQVNPLSSSDFGPGLLDLARSVGGRRVGGREGFVEGQADGLDRDVGGAGLLEKGSQNSSRHVATTTDGDHELRLEFFQNAGRGLLAQFVDLSQRR